MKNNGYISKSVKEYYGKVLQRVAAAKFRGQLFLL
jgi:hypothetical protein